MLDGLVIAREKSLFDEININLSTDLSYFEFTDSLANAESLIGLDVFDYLMVIENDFEVLTELLEGIQYLEELKSIPILCFTSQRNAHERKTLWEMEVTDIIELPVAKDELSLRLERFFLDISEHDTDEQTFGMQGKLEDYNLLDIVQTMEQNKKTAMLTLYHGRDEGRIWFQKGKIADAEYRKFNNLDAIFKLVTWMQGDFTITFADEEYDLKIEAENSQILLDAIQYIDNRNKLLEDLPDLHETLLISPETDMQLMEVRDMSYLKFFQGGQTIAAYLFAFDEDELKLLQKLKDFMDKQLLMNREQFDSHMTEQEKQIGEAGIKNVFKKIFKGKSQANEDQTPTTDLISDETLGGEQHADDVIYKKFDSFFKRDEVDLKKLKAALEKL